MATISNGLSHLQKKQSQSRRKSNITIPDENDLHFYETISIEEFQARMEKITCEGRIPPSFSMTEEKMLEKLSMCGRHYLIVRGLWDDKVALSVIRNSGNLLLPISLIKREIPLEVAKVEFAEYFI